MMRRIVLVLLPLLLIVVHKKVHADVCASSASLFDCPPGQHCSDWNDGCNDCSCGEDASVARCTTRMCGCMASNSCGGLAACTSNDACFPRPRAPVSAGCEAAPFECQQGLCGEWHDGCNDCSCGNGQALCTAKWCHCMADGSCGAATCKDNLSCVATSPPTITPTASPLAQTPAPVTLIPTKLPSRMPSNPPATATPTKAPSSSPSSDQPLSTALPTTPDLTRDPPPSEACQALASLHFVCPEGEQCRRWTDGCNECYCGDDGEAYCLDQACEETMGKACLDNQNCVPQQKNQRPAKDPPPPLPSICAQNAPFDCPGEGEYCTEWSDGCNECLCLEGRSLCTQNLCLCSSGDNTCDPPRCKSNPECVPKPQSSIGSIVAIVGGSSGGAGPSSGRLKTSGAALLLAMGLCL